MRPAPICYLKTIFVLALLSYGSINKSLAQVRPINPAAALDALQTGFVTVPDSIQTSVYWYWISGNISKQGVIKDLEAMKKVGINRAFIGNIGLDNVPDGKVKMFTDEWWKFWMRPSKQQPS